MPTPDLGQGVRRVSVRTSTGAGICTALLVAAFLAALAPSPSAESDPAASYAPAPRQKPNIVLILTDDMRADELRFMPNVRRLLVRQGTRYREAISPHPLCCPARAELMTGQYGHNNGVQDNGGRWGGYPALIEKNNTIAAWLQAAGYRTSHHGKYLNGYQKSDAPREPGWTRWDTQVRGVYTYNKLAEFADGDVIEGGYITHIITARSNRTIRRFSRSGDPFFTVINHVAPHGAAHDGRWRPPISERRYRSEYRGLLPPSYGDPSFQEKDTTDLPWDLQREGVRTQRLVWQARARARALRSVDDAVAATVRRLSELGELRNTYVVFTSDNGFNLGEHRLRGKNLPLDESFDVPLVVRGPGVRRGAVVSTPVSLVDLPATFLDWAGSNARPGRPQDGLSLDEVAASSRDTLLVQIGDQVADATPGWKYRGVTTDRYLYATHAGDPATGVLFDRRTDPHALVNLFADPAYAAIRAELAARTAALSACSGPRECNREFGPLPEPTG
jgi:arylsulfatase A-like enzyme